MDFCEALEQLDRGYGCRRTKWNHPKAYIWQSCNGNITLIMGNSRFSTPTPWTCTDKDLTAKDWCVRNAQGGTE